MDDGKFPFSTRKQSWLGEISYFLNGRLEDFRGFSVAVDDTNGEFDLYAGHGSFQMSSEKNPGCLGYIGDEILPSYVGIIISHYKDPYEPISRMECHKGFERCSDGVPIWSMYGTFTYTFTIDLGHSCG